MRNGNPVHLDQFDTWFILASDENCGAFIIYDNMAFKYCHEIIISQDSVLLEYAQFWIKNYHCNS